MNETSGPAKAVSTRRRQRWLVPAALVAGAAIAAGALTMRPTGIATARSVATVSVSELRPADGGGYLSASPAGALVVAEKDEGLWLLAAGREPQPLFVPPPGDYARQPSVSPDGGRVAFAHASAAGTAISVIGLDGNGLTAITSPESTLVYDSEPAWSPDGTKIAFTRTVITGMGPVTTDDSVMIVAVAGTAAPLKLADGTHPTWSPDGRSLVYSRRTGDQETDLELVLVRIDGSLTASLGPGSQPAWAPKGQLVAYIRTDTTDRVLRSRPDGTPWLVVQEWSREVWVLHVGSAERFRLTESTPVPDFDLAVWQRESEAAGPPVAGRLVAVVTGNHDDWGPAWGADGRTLLFVRSAKPGPESAGGFSVYRLTLELR